MRGVPVKMQAEDKWLLDYESHAAKLSKNMVMYWKGKEPCVLTKRGGTFGWFVYFEDEDITMCVDTKDLFFELRVNPWTVPISDLIPPSEKEEEEKTTTTKEKKIIKPSPTVKPGTTTKKKKPAKAEVRTDVFTCKYNCGFTSTSSQGIGMHYSGRHKKDGYTSRADSRSQTKPNEVSVRDSKPIQKQTVKNNDYWKIKYETVLEVIDTMKLHGEIECKTKAKS